MSKSQQIERANRAKARSERSYMSALSVWNSEVAAEWTPGTVGVSDDAIEDLKVLERQQLTLAANRILGFDMREYKDIFEDVATLIVAYLLPQMNQRIPMFVSSVTSTVEERQVSVNAVAQEEGYSARQSRAALRSHLKSQRLTIAVTESEWITELSRKTAVVSVIDPLKGTVGQVAALLRVGDLTGAKRLSREALDMAKMPLSISQAELIRDMNAEIDRLVTPLGQAQAATTLEARAERLGSVEKEWVTVGDGVVRPSHNVANGQTRAVDEPFELQGGLLQHPGDGSLGASLKEIIRCRCAAAYL